METNEKFAAIKEIIEDSSYWSSLNNGVLPKGLRDLQEALSKTPSLDSIKVIASNWLTKSYRYKPNKYFAKFPPFKLLCDAIVSDDAKLVRENITKINNFRRNHITATLHSLRNNMATTLLRQANLMSNTAKKQQVLEEAADSYLVVAKAYTNNKALARKALQQILAISQDDIRLFHANYEMGILLKESKKHRAEALEFFKRAGEIAENADLTAIQKSRPFFQYGQLLFLRGIEQLSEDELRAVIRNFGKALSIRPDYMRAKSILNTMLTENSSRQHLSTAMIAEIEALLNENNACLLAVRQGDLSRFNELCSVRPEWANVKDENNNTILHIAAEQGHIELFDAIITNLGNVAGIGYNIPNKDGMTPLFLAIQSGQVTAARVLLDNGALVKCSGKNALQIAIEYNHASIVSMLLQECYKESLSKAFGSPVDLLLFTIKHTENKEILEQVFNYFPDNLNDLSVEDNITPIQQAVISNNTQAILILNRNRVDLTALDTKVQDEQSATLFSKTKIELEQLRAKDDARITVFVAKVRNRLSETNGRWRKIFSEKTKREDEFNTELKAALEANTSCWQALRNAAFDSSAWEEQIAAHLVNKATNIIKKAGKFRSDLKFNTEVLRASLKTVVHRLKSRAAAPIFIPKTSSEAIESKSNNEKVKQFYLQFVDQMEDAYGYLSAVARNDAVTEQTYRDQQLAEVAKQNAKRLSDIPHAPAATGQVASAVISFVVYLRKYFSEQEAINMRDFFAGSRTEQRVAIFKEAARFLIHRYYEQITAMQLSPRGVTFFADCAAARIIAYITKKSKKHVANRNSTMLANAFTSLKSLLTGKQIPHREQQRKALGTIFLDAIIEVSSSFPNENVTLELEHNAAQRHWRAKGIFDNTGVITEDNGYYKHSSSEVAKYGFCRGTNYEISIREFREIDDIPDRTKKPALLFSRLQSKIDRAMRPNNNVTALNLVTDSGATVFVEHEVIGDGSCGFHCIPVKREAAAELLLRNSHHNNILRLVAPEIKATLLLAYTSNAQSSFTSMNRYNALYKEYIEAQHALNSATTPETITSNQNRLLQAENALEEYYLNEDVFKAYVTNHLATDGWLGYRSALALARLQNFSLTIYRKDHGQLTILESYKASSDNAYHILHTNGFTHFNLLEQTATSSNSISTTTLSV